MCMILHLQVLPFPSCISRLTAPRNDQNGIKPLEDGDQRTDFESLLFMQIANVNIRKYDLPI